MTELTAYDDPTPDLTEHERTTLRWAGANERLIEVCSFEIEMAKTERRDGKTIRRHSVLEEVKKYLRGTPHSEPSLEKENAEEFNPYGGHFFTALWEGDLYRAFSRADYNNRAIMLEVFGVRRINNHRPMHGEPVTA